MGRLGHYMLHRQRRLEPVRRAQRRWRCSTGPTPRPDGRPPGARSADEPTPRNAPRRRDGCHRQCLPRPRRRPRSSPTPRPTRRPQPDDGAEHGPGAGRAALRPRRAGQLLGRDRAARHRRRPRRQHGRGRVGDQPLRADARRRHRGLRPDLRPGRRAAPLAVGRRADGRGAPRGRARPQLRRPPRGPVVQGAGAAAVPTLGVAIVTPASPARPRRGVSAASPASPPRSAASARSPVAWSRALFGWRRRDRAADARRAAAAAAVALAAHRGQRRPPRPVRRRCSSPRRRPGWCCWCSRPRPARGWPWSARRWPCSAYPPSPRWVRRRPDGFLPARRHPQLGRRPQRRGRRGGARRVVRAADRRAGGARRCRVGAVAGRRRAAPERGHWPARPADRRPAAGADRPTRRPRARRRPSQRPRSWSPPRRARARAPPRCW